MGGFTIQILVGNVSPPGDGMVIITQLTHGLVLSVLDSQSLGAGFDAWTEVYLSILFLPHLCQLSNYYHKLFMLLFRLKK